MIHIFRPVRAFLARQRHPVVLFTYGLAVLAWLLLATRSVPMPGADMVMRISAPGMPEAMALSGGFLGVGLYLLVWGAMITAMMYPSSANAFRAYYEANRDTTSGRRTTAVVTTMATYTLVWVLTGLVPLGVALVIPIATLTPGNWTILLAVTLLLLSAYQLTSLKRHHLDHCRSPERDFAGGTSGIPNAVRSGWRLALDSIGCCWALMALMIVIGSMNLLWMAALTVLISAEILALGGERLAKGIGVLSGLGGIGVVIVGAM